ncbi:MAG: hypothetical protein EU981_01885 [Candidatus Liberibacter ctenarytainae]|uniref:Uncharacterized protein n=1 Tax=Candidatus Liberibacter ctenarytainae TaxID=2020335 RepID=A0A937AQ17_9HYPH|nr:hypothetical protein [Candidatus Liberibacter ctenarytainae]
METNNYYSENILNKNRKIRNVKPLIQIFQEIVMRAIVTNRQKNIKSMTREFIESWMAYNSRAWRINQPRTYVRIHLSIHKNSLPVLIHIGNIQNRKTKNEKI